MRLTNISFLCVSRIATPTLLQMTLDPTIIATRRSCCSHIGRVAQLALFVLKVGIVGRIGVLMAKVTVRVRHVVGRRSGAIC